ncbi:MAG: Ankyrin, partial [Candidatus Uhrbacteria bacterium GW2011_GWD2_52_7]
MTPLPSNRMLDRGVDVNARDDKDMPLLMAAAAAGHDAVLALLLGKGADVNGVITKGPRQGTTALML